MLWAGNFGDAYTRRNRDASAGRRDFWERMVAEYGFRTVLEVGCNNGANLVHLADLLGDENVTGVDVNASALLDLHERLPAVETRLASGSDLPFPDRSFDLVFTAGVLIHIPDEGLHRVMSEIVRCARTHVLCIEYVGNREVEYRGTTLYKRKYGYLYHSLFPELLRLVDSGTLRRPGWDDMTYWMFER